MMTPSQAIFYFRFFGGSKPNSKVVQDGDWSICETATLAFNTHFKRHGPWDQSEAYVMEYIFLIIG